MADRTITVGETTAGPGDGGVDPGQPVELPIVEVLSGRGFGTGKSGSGKSNTGSVICEELLERAHSFLVIDIEGEYFSLKENHEVLHVGADEEVDLRVGPEHAEKIARLALEQHVPVVLDVSGYLDDDVRDELIYEVVRHLFAKEKSLRKNFLLIVEEMHEFVPQQGSLDDAGKMIVRVAKRGRKRGLGVVGMSQRPANVSKDFITQCDWIVWHRLTWSNDTDVVRNVLTAEHAEAVEDLAAGEAFLQADFMEPDVRRMQWRRKRTFDAGATPTLDDSESPELMSIDEDLLSELEEISEAAEQRDDELEQLRDRVETLQEDLDEKDERIERLTDLREMVESVDGFGADRADTMTVEFDGTAFDVPEVIQAEVLEVREEKRELEDDLDQLQEERDDALERVERLEAELEEAETSEELQQLRDDLRELALDRYPDLLGVETDERVDELRRELEHARETIDELESRRPDEVVLETELLANDVVREYIDEVAAASQYAADNVWDVVIALSSLADGKSARVTEIERQVPLAEKTVLAIANHLAENGVATKAKEGRSNVYALDRAALRDRISLTDHQRAIAETRERIRPEGGPEEATSGGSDGAVQTVAEERGAVQDQLMAGFQEEAVERLMARIDALSSRQRRLLTYIESRGKNVPSQKAWVQRALGLDSNPNREHYDEMGELIDDGFVRQNSDNSIKPNVRGLVEDELDGYDFDAADVEETYQDVLTAIADG